MNTKQIIIEAIGRRSVIEFTSNDHRQLVEPHAVGETDNGLMMLCWQRLGESPESVGWRWFALESIGDVIATPRWFEPREIELGEHDFSCLIRRVQ